MLWPGRPIEVLLIAHDSEVGGTATRVFEALRVRNRLSIAHDGAEAMALLRREGEHAAAPRANLILLDLDLGRGEGRKLLAEIKEDPELGRIPVVVLMSPGARSDVRDAYEMHANCCVAKPARRARFLEVMQAIASFWLTVVCLPVA
jgi:CheY-like chemotaxis protein